MKNAFLLVVTYLAFLAFIWGLPTFTIGGTIAAFAGAAWMVLFLIANKEDFFGWMSKYVEGSDRSDR